MNEQLRAKMIERIRRLLALSQSSNEHEAASAAEKAQTLLAEYNLSLSDIEIESDEDDITTDGEIETNSYPWRRMLGTCVAQLYFCTYFYQTIAKEQLVNEKIVKTKIDKHSFVGTPTNIMVAKMMFDYLHKTVDRLAKDGCLKVPVKERGEYRMTFRHVAALRLARRIHERIEAAKKGEVVASDGRNLPALASMYDQIKPKLEEHLEKTIGKLRSTKVGKVGKKTFHAEGYADGRAAGDSIGLDQQVGNKKQHHLAKD